MSIWWIGIYVRANFSLKSGDKSNLDANVDLKENRFDPDLVKTITLSYENNRICPRIDGILLNDRNNN